MLLRRGNMGNGVAAVQFALNSLTAFMPKLKTDGVFGPKTDERVRQHQSAQRLKPDGVVGRVTIGTLFEAVALTGTTKITHLNDSVGRGTAFAASLAPTLRPPNLGPMPSPELAAWARAHEAFRQWWIHPPPKPTLINPTFGPIPLPKPPLNIFAPPEPAQTANFHIKHEPEEGGNVTLHFQQETTHSSINRIPKEQVFRIAVEWLVLKGRGADLALQPSINKKNANRDWFAEVEFSITSARELALQLESGIFELKMAGHFAAAISSELSAELFLGPKLDAEIALIGPGGLSGTSALKIFATAQGGLRLGYGPEKLPSGREVTHIETPSFVGSTTVGIGLMF
jgi:hypothetical protein